MIQNIIVGLIICGAVFYLARRFYLASSHKKQPGCEKCAVNTEKR